MATEFGAVLLRLKQQVGLHADKEVADLLGLGEKAFHARKTRGSFPEDKLFALATKRPELGIDVNYVLTGESSLQTVQRMLANLPSRVRGQRGALSQQQFAQQLDVPVTELADVEAGRARPSPAFMNRYIAAFPSMAPTYLAGDEAPKLTSPMSHAEVVLVQHFRASGDLGQRALAHQAKFFAQAMRDYNRAADDALPDIDLVADYNPKAPVKPPKGGRP